MEMVGVRLGDGWRRFIVFVVLGYFFFIELKYSIFRALYPTGII